MKMDTSMNAFARWLAAAGLWMMAAACGAQTLNFASPELAVEAMAGLIGQRDDARLTAVFGPGSAEMFSSGDAIADREDFGRVAGLIAEKVAFEDIEGKRKVVLLGNAAWPWPIPLIGSAQGWRFDTAAGREELLNRRIGRNELETLASLRAVVAAQREYAAAGRDGKPPAFARKFRSSPGLHDGLYWEEQGSGDESPLGDLLADSEHAASGEPLPFQGYFYRMLDAQGPHAPGGARSYTDATGQLGSGFAVIAWPAKYGNSGVMSFLINQFGIPFEKDLGADTAAVAAGIRAFDPDASWQPTADGVRTPEDAPVEAATAD